MGGGQVRGRLDLHVRAEAASLAQIRRALAEFLAEHELEQRRQDALLVVHELAANAIEHASGGDDHLEVSVRLERETLLIRVLDPARTATRPAPLEPDQSRESGRGMLIVNRLARWSEQLKGDRREVTAQLPLRPDAVRTPAPTLGGDVRARAQTWPRDR
jgi:anti-sigma regulatory factor (Ser/Thr protein kinase)